MGAPFRIAQFSLSTSASGTQDLTIGGESRTPVVAFIHAVQATSTATFTADMAQSFGATDGTNEWVGTIWSEDNVGTSNCAHELRNDACIMFVAGAGGGTFSVNSLITGGIRLDIDSQMSGAWLCNVWFCFEGTWSVGTHTTSASAMGTATESGLGHDPNVLVLMSMGDKNFNTGVSNDTKISLGFVADNSTSGVQQISTAWWEDDNRGSTDVRTYADSSDGSHNFGPINGQHVTYAFVSGGFESTAQASQTNYVGFLAGTIDSDPWAGAITGPDSGDIGGDYDTTEPNVESVAGMFLAAGHTAIASAPTGSTLTGATAGAYGLSMFTSLDDGLFCAGVSEDNRSTTDTASYANTQLIDLSFTVGGSAHAATFVSSRTAGGFTQNVTQAPATARVYAALMFGAFPEAFSTDDGVDVADEANYLGNLMIAVDDQVDVSDEALIQPDPMLLSADDQVDVADEAQYLEGLVVAADDQVDVADDAQIVPGTTPVASFPRGSARRAGIEAGQGRRSGAARGQGGRRG